LSKEITLEKIEKDIENLTVQEKLKLVENLVHLQNVIAS